MERGAARAPRVAPALPWEPASPRAVRRVRTAYSLSTAVPPNQHLNDDAIYVALETLQYSADEIAAALGVDVYSLWSYYGGERRVPGFVLQRLTLLLQRRAALMRDLAALLGSRELEQTPSVLS